jgi:hypothetical protein
MPIHATPCVLFGALLGSALVLLQGCSHAADLTPTHNRITLKDESGAVVRNPCGMPDATILHMTFIAGGDIMLQRDVWQSPSHHENVTLTVATQNHTEILRASELISHTMWTNNEDVMMAVDCTSGELTGAWIHNGNAWVMSGDYSGAVRSTDLGGVSETICGTADIDNTTNSTLNGSRRLAVDRWTNCYPGDTTDHVLDIGLAMGSELLSSVFRNNEQVAMNWMKIQVDKTNLLYRQQLGVTLRVKDYYIAKGASNAPWDNVGCSRDIEWQLGSFQNWNKPSTRGLWHLFDACWTGQAGRTTAGLATTGAICLGRCNVNGVIRNSCNAGVSYYTTTNGKWNGNFEGEDKTFQTFAHEVGHNFGARHSFEGGQGMTGGIMDYDTGRGILLDGEVQFNTVYRKNEICSHLSAIKNSCPYFSAR